jgi:hypothetical protein
VICQRLIPLCEKLSTSVKSLLSLQKYFVIPAKAGIQFFQRLLDARLRGHDAQLLTPQSNRHRPFVIPAKAGIQFFQRLLDARLRGHDVQLLTPQSNRHRPFVIPAKAGIQLDERLRRRWAAVKAGEPGRGVW